MAYIGSTPTSQNFISGTDYFNGTGSQTAFTLTRSVNSVNDIEVVVNNVIQQPNSYTVSGTTLTLSAAPSSGTSNVYVRYLATNQQSFTVGNNTVGYNQLTTDMQSKFAMKNRIINGDMRIDQRNAGASVTYDGSTGYSIDRYFSGEIGNGAFTIQRVADAPAGFVNSMKMTVTTAQTGTLNAITMQPIEGFNTADLGWGTENAKTVTLSFWVKSSVTGSLGGAIQNSDYTRSYPFSYTVNSANTWEYKTVTIAGDTSGTWQTGNSVGIYVRFSHGTSLTGTASTWASADYRAPTGSTWVIQTLNATWQLTGVQLEVGVSATGFDYRPYGTELALCQRYYYQLDNAVNCASYGDGTTTTDGNIICPVPLRGTPTVVTTGTVYTWKPSSAYASQSAPAITVLSFFQNNILYSIAGWSGLTNGYSYVNYISNLRINAEL